MRREIILFIRVILLFSLFICVGCATLTPQQREYNDFIVIKTTPGDTIISYADKYLRDPSKYWLIAEFNQINMLDKQHGVTSSFKPLDDILGMTFEEWRGALFKDIMSLTVGKELIIPLKPYKRGGLKAGGYQTVPVLLYHRFHRNKFSKLTVSKPAFERQMRFLMDNGYHVVTVDQLLDFLDFKGQLPEKSVVIAIDDGWRSVYDIAYPILKKHGFPATLFVYTDLIDTENGLSWEQLSELEENGIDIQCHSMTHENLDEFTKGSMKKNFEALEKEISQSKALIENNLSKQCNYFSYPGGKPNSFISKLLKKQGYRGAFTYNRGGNPFFVDNYMINRSIIYGSRDLKGFKKSLEIFYESILE